VHATHSPVSISLYSPQGKLIANLIDKKLEAGDYSMSLPSIAAGMYLCRMEGKGITKTINVVVRK